MPEIAAMMGIGAHLLQPYGSDLAKIKLDAIDELVGLITDHVREEAAYRKRVISEPAYALSIDLTGGDLSQLNVPLVVEAARSGDALADRPCRCLQPGKRSLDDVL